MMVENMNLALNPQTERLLQDNWQIPRWNEMLRMLKITSVFALCQAKNHFVLIYCLTLTQKIHSFFVRWVPSQFSNRHIRKLLWSVTCWHFIWRNQSKSDWVWSNKDGILYVSNESAGIKSFMGMVRNIYQVNEIFQGTRRTNHDFHLLLLLRGYPGEIIIICEASFVFWCPDMEKLQL